MPRKRGTRSELPPRTSSNRRLNIKPVDGKFFGDSDFSTAEIVEALRDAGWEPSVSNRSVDKAAEPKWLLPDPSCPRKVRWRSPYRAEPEKYMTGNYDALYEKLRAVAEEIQDRDHVMTAIFWCVRHYVLARENAAKPNEFRSELKDFEKALKAFAGKVPTADSALGKAIEDEIHEKLYSKFEAWLRSRGAVSIEYALLSDFWDDLESHQLVHLSEVLQITLEVVSSLRVAESGRGKDADREAHGLVAKLGGIFERTTGRSPSRANDPYKDDKNDKVIGNFGKFVRAVNKQIPTAFRLNDVDNLIRALVEGRGDAV